MLQQHIKVSLRSINNSCHSQSMLLPWKFHQGLVYTSSRMWGWTTEVIEKSTVQSKAFIRTNRKSNQVSNTLLNPIGFFHQVLREGIQVVLHRLESAFEKIQDSFNTHGAA